MPDVTTVEHRLKAGQVRDWLATVRSSEDLISVGAYVPGSNPRIDEALSKRDRIETFLKQDADDLAALDASVSALQGL